MRRIDSELWPKLKRCQPALAKVVPVALFQAAQANSEQRPTSSSWQLNSVAGLSPSNPAKRSNSDTLLLSGEDSKAEGVS